MIWGWFPFATSKTHVHGFYVRCRFLTHDVLVIDSGQSPSGVGQLRPRTVAVHLPAFPLLPLLPLWPFWAALGGIHGPTNSGPSASSRSAWRTAATILSSTACGSPYVPSSLLRTDSMSFTICCKTFGGWKLPPGPPLLTSAPAPPGTFTAGGAFCAPTPCAWPAPGGRPDGSVFAARDWRYSYSRRCSSVTCGSSSFGMARTDLAIATIASSGMLSLPVPFA